MTATVVPPIPLVPPRARRSRPLGLGRDLARPSQVFSHLTPNWYASVMGTGIVAVAATTLPYQVPGLHSAAVGIWASAAALLVGLTAATVTHWVRHPATARGHAAHPVVAHFYGAVPMAVLTVGAGTVLIGRDVIGLRVAVDVDWVLWGVGTVAGLVTAAVVPHRMATRGHMTARDAFGGWLMPVVPPMVSASTGALLVPHAPAGPVRSALLLGCYALFTLALVASAGVVVLICRRLVGHGVGDAALVPTLWIVLGPLGQSVTAANLLGGVAHQALPAPYAGVLRAAGVGYGVPVWGLAIGWAGVASVLTLRTARTHLPFGLSWWSFTFPVGTVVTGTAALARHTGAAGFAVAAAVLYAGLVVAWVVVAGRTALGSLRGGLFLAPVPRPVQCDSRETASPLDPTRKSRSAPVSACCTVRT